VSRGRHVPDLRLVEGLAAGGRSIYDRLWEGATAGEAEPGRVERREVVLRPAHSNGSIDMSPLCTRRQRSGFVPPIRA